MVKVSIKNYLEAFGVGNETKIDFPRNFAVAVAVVQNPIKFINVLTNFIMT